MWNIKLLTILVIFLAVISMAVGTLNYTVVVNPDGSTKVVVPKFPDQGRDPRNG